MIRPQAKRATKPLERQWDWFSRGHGFSTIGWHALLCNPLYLTLVSNIGWVLASDLNEASHTLAKRGKS